MVCIHCSVDVDISTRIMYLNDHRCFFFVVSFCYSSYSCRELASCMHIECCMFFGNREYSISSCSQDSVGMFGREKSSHVYGFFFRAHFLAFFCSLSLFRFRFTIIMLCSSSVKICLHLLCPSTNFYCLRDRAQHDFVCR